MIRYNKDFHSEFTSKQLFDLVADIESYPSFLPWCSGAKIIDQGKDSCTAELIIYFAPLSYKYISNVYYDSSMSSIKANLKEGPFECLNNIWSFKQQQCGTTINFSLEFECKSKMLEKMISLMFKQALLKLVNAFQKRAEELYCK